MRWEKDGLIKGEVLQTSKCEPRTLSPNKYAIWKTSENSASLSYAEPQKNNT